VIDVEVPEAVEVSEEEVGGEEDKKGDRIEVVIRVV
jgi:hypothetical protein